jgi:hypothetical protein
LYSEGAELDGGRLLHRTLIPSDFFPVYLSSYCLAVYILAIDSIVK